MRRFFALGQPAVGIGLHLNCKTMKTTVFTLCLWLGITGIASGQSFHYLEVIPNDLNTTPPKIATDPQGNTYVTGNFYYDLEIDGFSVSCEVEPAVYVAKFNKNGNIQWLKSIEATVSAFSYEITYNKTTKGILVCGGFTGELNAGAGTYPSHGDVDGFWVSMDGLGNLLSAQTDGGENWDAFTDIGADKNGNIYVSGNSYSAAITFDGIPQQMAEVKTGLIAKYTGSGMPIWMRTVVASSFIDMNNIEIAANGTTYFAFNTVGSYSIYNGPDDYYSIIKDVDEENIVIYSLTKNGSTNQFTEFPVTDMGTKAADISYDGEVTLAINFYGSIEINGETYISDGGTNVILVRISFTTFEIKWVNHFSSTHQIYAHAIKSDNGNILVTGHYFEYAEAAGIVIENPFIDYESFLATVSIPSGIVLGFVDFDNVEAEDYITDIDVDKNGNIYMLGVFGGDIYFDDLYAVGDLFSWDLFLTRLNATIFKEENPIAEQSIQVYPNPTTAYITAEGLSGTWHITNMQGQVIMSGESDNEISTTINVQSLPTGTYLLSYTNNAQQITTQQFIKQ